MASYELSPAYGRDYKTATAAKVGFATGKDWKGDYQLGFQYVNEEQLKTGDTVRLRYSSNRKVTVATVGKPDKVTLAVLALL